MTNPQITVYGRPHCGMCDATDRKITKTGLEPLTTHEQLADHPDVVAECKNLGIMEAPVVIVRWPDGTTDRFGGYRPDRLGAIARQLAPTS